VKIRDYGDTALLLEFSGTAEVLAAADAVRAAALPGVLDIVPAARTVLLTLSGATVRDRVRDRLSGLPFGAAGDALRPPPGRPDVVVDVVYDGPDLDEVAEHTGLTRQDVVAAHTGRPWRVAFGGFAPGFGYLIGGDPRLTVPRRAEPRTRVPAGAVALAGEFSGVYPRDSPGGWQLIGHTEAVLWDIDRDPPALLTPGRWVGFRAVPGR